MNIYTYITRISLFIIMLLLCNSTNAFAAFPRTPIPGIYTRDMTIYRTVNTLSCHPQNPLLHEVPHYVMFNPLWVPPTNGPYNSKGACWAYHNEGNTNFAVVGFQKPGLPGSEDATALRPASPTHHYMVIELPNPKYDPAKEQQCINGQLSGGAAFCGKYMHWEGYSFMFQLALIEGDHEVWYVKNFLGGMDVQGRNILLKEQVGTVKLNAQGYPDNNGTPYTVYAGKLNEGITNIHWKCASSATGDGPIRLGERGTGNNFISGYPCLNIKFTMQDVPFDVYANPLLFSDIPHNRFSRNPRSDVDFGDGDQFPIRDWYDDIVSRPDSPNDHLRDDNDDLWVKCNGKNGQIDIFKTVFSQYGLTSYRAYIDKFRAFVASPNTNNVPVAPYTPSGCDYPPLETDPGIVWTTYNGQPFPNAGPKPTTPQQLLALTNKWVSEPVDTTPPTSTPLLGDVNLDHVVDIRDYNLMSAAVKTNRNAPYDTNSNGQVDIFDYTIVIRNFGMTNE